MKSFKILLSIVIAAMAFGACSNEIDGEQAMHKMRLRSQDEAIQIAENAYSAFLGKSSRATNNMVKDDGTFAIKGRASRGQSNDTIMYVVNFKDDAGFALVSAKPNTEGLIGIAEEGHYTPGEDCNNGAFESYLSNAINYIETQSLSNFPPVDTIINHPGHPDPGTFVDEVIASVGPKVKVKWGTGAPCSNLITNYNHMSLCTSIAMALTYFRFHDYFHPTYPGSYGRVPLMWDLMCKHIGGDEGCTEPSDSLELAHDMIEIMCRQIAHNINYLNTDDDIDPYPRYKCKPLDFDICGLINPYYFYSCIDDNMLLVHGISATSSEYFWLLDGYKVTRTNLPGIPPHTATYIHHNWAADGRCNGYYLEDVYNTSNHHSLDNNNNNFNFNANETYIYEIRHHDFPVGEE